MLNLSVYGDRSRSFKPGDQIKTVQRVGGVAGQNLSGLIFPGQGIHNHIVFKRRIQVFRKGEPLNPLHACRAHNFDRLRGDHSLVAAGTGCDKAKYNVFLIQNAAARIFQISVIGSRFFCFRDLFNYIIYRLFRAARYPQFNLAIGRLRRIIQGSAGVFNMKGQCHCACAGNNHLRHIGSNAFQHRIGWNDLGRSRLFTGRDQQNNNPNVFDFHV